MNAPTVTSLVNNGQMAEFVGCDGNYLRYEVSGVEFPVPLQDTKQGYFGRTVKAISLMRWIRKHVDNLRLAEAAEESVG